MLRTALALAGALALAAAPAHARAPRNEVVPYQGTNGVTGAYSLGWGPLERAPGKASIGLLRIDRTVAVTVTDASGLPVPFTLWHSPIDRPDKLLGEYCGSTPAPIRLPFSGGRVNVHVLTGVCGPNPAVPTTGTVRFRLA